MRVDEFDYELPPELIAQAPPAERGASRLLHLPADALSGRDLWFRDLPGLLRAGDLLVVNDTRVVNARLVARKESGGGAEVLVERPLAERRFLALVRASHAPRAGTWLVFADGIRACVLGRRDAFFELELEAGHSLDELLREHGRVPLPPYIRRAPDAGDASRYQTVYAARDGAVAAPTAGLHFDTGLLDRLRAQGVSLATLTLHVGAGTFQPVRAAHVEAHVMHAERVQVDRSLCAAVSAARACGGRVVAVGTTCVRALESVGASGVLEPFDGDTRLFIQPGHRFQIVDALITNFHLPRSTLLMLVAAFAGTERVLAAYRHAVAAGYRFFSYGDAMFIERAGP